ncbi:MAG: Clp protease N-terminal domain-containing protein [Gemmataceae bacterium]
MSNENLTDRARKVLELANAEACRFSDESVGPEHLLLALVAEGTGVAANVLKNLDIDLRRLRREVERLHSPSDLPLDPDRRRVSFAAGRAIARARKEAKRLGHDYVGTEHLLLGLLKEEDTPAAQILIGQGLTLHSVRDEILNLLGVTPAPFSGSGSVGVTPDDGDADLPEPARAILLEIQRQIGAARERKADAVAALRWEDAAALRALEGKLNQLRNAFIRQWRGA